MVKTINKGMGGHQSAAGRTNNWLTPLEIIKSLGEFDLDPCSAIDQPWPTAKKHYTEIDNGLLQTWFGRVWLNPPYTSTLINSFMKKMAEHNNGIALTFARTDTDFFHRFVFPVASSLFFVKRRIVFCNVGGIRSRYDGGAPSVFISYGEYNAEVLDRSGFKGRHIPLNTIPVFVVGISPTWCSVVRISLSRLNGAASLKSIYDMVEMLAPDKIKSNSFYKEKIRQTLQHYFNRIEKGVYSIPVNQ